ncbi:LuxR family transcriptional regulator [Sphingobium lactosutens]|uniref:response regulator transcription factor n=1 Tax=Sphingobium lactosutens TaxID=522773 RepID=UPI0015B7C31E|nr:helix-turn-helix transcriptional regulator [Sphingobium lactosutens]NWK95851.1 LuxR family transcriptional regulator [Sphingobium lactosutens]
MDDTDLESWLTQREVEVLRHIAKGQSAKEIALTLKIAPRTVERHIGRVRLKTRTRNRSHMVAFAISKGLIGCALAVTYVPPLGL